MYSYWQSELYFREFDLLIVGSGIVGLSTAISFVEINPRARVLILEQGLIPEGASIKNAGFACFGSAGEVLSDLETLPEQEVMDTVKMRWDGLALLRKRIGAQVMEFEALGGYELFQSKAEFEKVMALLPDLNRRMSAIIGSSECYRVDHPKTTQFPGTVGCISNSQEGQLHTGKMLRSLMQKCHELGVTILGGLKVEELLDLGHRVEVKTPFYTFFAGRVVVATNGFTQNIIPDLPVLPARAQVLITQPLAHNPITGAYHFEQGFYYFRNVGSRVLLGGGRNLDLPGETTMEPAITRLIQNSLEHWLKTMILPGIEFRIEQRWSGIMGVGPSKKPLIQWTSPRVLAAVRMGGMGIAIGSMVGLEAARLASQ